MLFFFAAEQHDIEEKAILCGVSFFQFSLIYLVFSKVITVPVKKVYSMGQHNKKYHMCPKTHSDD